MLARLKLTAIRDRLDTLLAEAARRELTLIEVVAYLCEREIGRKNARRIDMALGLARFPMVRELSGYVFAAQPTVVATAILDRRLHHSHLITIRGESCRLKEKRRAGHLTASKQRDPSTPPSPQGVDS